MHGRTEEWSLESLAEALQRFGALKTPPEFVIGRLTEFNYQSSKDGSFMRTRKAPGCASWESPRW
jgi:hypothetical protein